MRDHSNETEAQTLRRLFLERTAKPAPVLTFENDVSQPAYISIQGKGEVPKVISLPSEVVKIEADKSIIPGARPGTEAGSSSLKVETVDFVPVVPSEPKRKGVSLRKELFLGEISGNLKKSNEARRAAKGDQLISPSSVKKE